MFYKWDPGIINSNGSELQVTLGFKLIHKDKTSPDIQINAWKHMKVL